MNLKSYNKLYRRIVFLVFFTFSTLILLFLLLLFLIFRGTLFTSNVINENTSLFVILIIISLLIISQGVTIFVSRRTIQPIRKISETINQIASGNFDVKIDPNQFKAEMRDLASAINLMVNEIKSMEVMRSDFVANVSHEFRAPLSAIQGYVTLLTNPSISNEKRDEYIKLLTESTQELSGLVDNVLKLSRLESQNIVQKNVKYSLDEQLRRSVLMFERQWSEKELELDLNLPECEFYGNEEMTGQIWINLIGNAVKFTEKGGKLGVNLDTSLDNKILVTIYDTGCGMTDDVKKHIFEKFYQGDSSRKSNGNGLGLALVNTITNLLGYNISVESELGKGSAFTVSLPK